MCFGYADVDTVTTFTKDTQVGRSIQKLSVSGPTLFDALREAAKGGDRFIHVCDTDSKGKSLVGVTFAWIGNDADRTQYNGAYYNVSAVSGEAPNLTFELTYATKANETVGAA